MLTSRIKKTITKYTLLNSGDHVVVAVSGGPDSVCLLSVLHALSKDFNLSLHVAHLDHMFRGRESADEAVFAAGLARKLGVPSTIEKVDVPAFCRERGLSAQAAAREVRYAFLSRVAAQVRASRIATGHTATDQAETFLLRLIRGAGMSGLSAIPAKRDDIIRPLIEVTREEILEYLREHRLDYVTDPSNTKPLYTRNRIRMEIFPLLKQFNPRIVETLASEASLLRAEEEAAEACLSKIAGSVIAREEGRVVLEREEFNQLPLALRRRLLMRAAEWMGVEPALLSSVQVDEAVTFLFAALTGRSMHLYDLVIEREYEKLVIRPKAKAAAYSHNLAVPGVTAVPDPGLAVETLIIDGDAAQDDSGPARTAGAADQENYFWQALFDYDKIKPLLKLRNRMPGDWFCPSGMGGKSKKLQDFFVDIRIPRHRRETVPLLTAGDDILWVVGLRTDERFRVGADTKRTLLVRFRTLPAEFREAEAAG